MKDIIKCSLLQEMPKLFYHLIKMFKFKNKRINLSYLYVNNLFRDVTFKKVFSQFLSSF